MIHLQEIAPEPGIYLLHDKEEHILYVGRANNLRVRLRQHEANYDIVKPWMCFFDEQFENLNLRIKEASDQEDGALKTMSDPRPFVSCYHIAAVNSLCECLKNLEA